MNINKIERSVLCLTLVGAITGCHPPTATPEDGGELTGETIVETELPDEQAMAQFAAAHAKYVDAKQDGALSPVECESVARAFDEVYEANPRSMLAARFNVGAVWEECGDMDKAVAVYEELGGKRYHLALNQLGVIAWNKGDTQAALELFAKSVDADKTQAFAARNNLAAAYRDRYSDKADHADFDVAETQIKNVLAVDTSNRAAYENLARLYYDRGRLEDRSYLVLANLVVTQALRVLDKQGQQSADIWNLKGLLLMQDDNQVDALKAFKRAVEVEPKHPDANRNIGFIAIRFRDYKTAVKAFDVALEDPAIARDVEVSLAMGVAKRGLNEFTDAERWYRRASELDENDPRPWYNLAILNQDHLIGQPGVEVEQLKEFYGIAKQNCTKFKKLAESNKDYSGAVEDCVDRIAIIDDALLTIENMAILEATIAELERQAEQQELARRAELLEIEKRALAAGEPSPEELADLAAEAEAKAEAEAVGQAQVRQDD